MIENRTPHFLSRIKKYWSEYKGTGNNREFGQFRQVLNKLTKGIEERRGRYKIKLIDKFAWNLKSLIGRSDSFQQAETRVLQLLGPNGSSNSKGDAAQLLSKQYSRPHQPTHTNFTDERFTCNYTGLTEVTQVNMTRPQS